MRRIIILLAVVTAGLMLASCAQRTMIVSANVMMPATSDDASKLRQVAVMPMPMPNGQNFSGEIESLLTSVTLDNRSYFTLVDRSALDKVMSEMQLSASGVTDNSVVANIGKLVGAKGIYTGAVTDSHSSSDSYTELRYYTECAAYSYVTGPYNTQIPVCVNWVQKSYPVSCVKRSAVFTFSIKLIDVETSRVVYASDPSSYQESRGCSDTGAASSGDQLLLIAKQNAKMAFRKDVAPYSQMVNIQFIAQPEGIKMSKDQDAFEQAIDYAKVGRLERTCEILGTIAQNEPSGFAVVYDLGVCAEAVGDLQKAQMQYNLADKIIGKPDAVVTASLRRVNNMIENKKKLDRQK